LSHRFAKLLATTPTFVSAKICSESAKWTFNSRILGRCRSFLRRTQIGTGQIVRNTLFCRIWF
jgi:hypothetical protein